MRRRRLPRATAPHGLVGRIAPPCGLLLMLATVPLLPVGCSLDNVAGGSIETTNGFVAMALYPDSTPVANATVRVRPRDYLKPVSVGPASPSLLNTTTGSDGALRVDSLEPGEYVVEINDGRSHAAAFDMVVSEERGRVDLGTVVVGPFASVSGRMERALNKAYVQVRGLERLAAIAPDGSYALRDLPGGRFTLQLIADDQDAQPLVLDSVRAEPGEITDVRYRSWSHAVSIYINTTASGANVAHDVCNFPLLLRFAGEIDSSAAPDGRDLRFTKADGTALPYEIEKWDTQDPDMVLWVLVDTIFGNRDSQLVRMYWGNPDAQSESNGAAVFAPSNGFGGVWHLDSASPTLFTDATGSGNHGTRAVALDETGVAGDGALFVDSGQYVDCGNGASLALSGQGTVSAWIRLSDAASDRYHRIVSKKDSLGDPHGYALECNPSYMGGFLTLVGQDSQLVRAYTDTVGGTPFWKEVWYYCAGVFDQTNEFVFRNGYEVTDYRMDSFNITPGTSPLIIGGKGADWFAGTIDEVRVERVARSPSWIKLCYATQIMGQRTVTVDW